MARALKLSASALLLALTAFPGEPRASADVFRVVAGGDSIMVGCVEIGNRLQRQFDDAGLDAQVTVAAHNGWTSYLYVGDGASMGERHDYRPDIFAADPDAVLIMLGVNDAATYPYQPNCLARYQASMTTLFDSVSGYVNSRGVHPKLLVSTVLPLLRQFPTDDQVRQVIVQENDWLRQQALERPDDIILIDTSTALQQQPGWESWYLDGVHLWGENEAGYEWMSAFFRDQLQAVNPTLEPLKSHPGDANRDGLVDLEDVCLLRENFGVTTGALWDQGDFTGDGAIDLQDLSTLRAHFGHGATSSPVTAVPEPAALSLLVLGGLAATRKAAVSPRPNPSRRLSAAREGSISVSGKATR